MRRCWRPATIIVIGVRVGFEGKFNQLAGVEATVLDPYDIMNRLTNLVYTSGGSQLLAQYIYAPNTNGQWKTATEIQWQSGASFSTNQVAWFYDNLGRLTNETCSSTATGLSYTNRYVFDLLGNRLWQTNILGGTTQTTGYTYNTNDQLLVESGAVSFTNLYDANGSLTNRTSGTETNGYAFNLQNRLASATIKRADSGHTISETISYTYDYKGNRVQAQWSRSVDGGASVSGTNIFVFEPEAMSGPNRVLEELPAMGATPTATYTLGAGIVSQKRSGTVSHFLPDGHGSTRLLSDTNAGIAARFTYDAYGKPLDFTANLYNAPAATLLYSGGQFDADLQQYNLQARYYNPAVGRFGQIDPFSPNQQRGANLYAYCADDPVNSSDPTGLYELDVHEFLTRFLAKAVGFDDVEAKTIGYEAQHLDYPGDPRDAMASDGRNNRILYHFPSYSRLLDMEEKVIQDYAADKLQGPNGSYQNFGEYIHADEDTFAHSTAQGYRDFNYYGDGIRGNGGTLGHARQGHRNDHTWTDVDKGMAMALQLYNDMQFAPIGRPRQSWSSIHDKIRDFIQYKPNVYWQSYGPFRVENVTFKGYTTKIQKLNPSYTIQPYDVYSKVFEDVEGFQGKDVGLQLKPKVATGVGIGIGILLSPIAL